jgi:UDP-3-O-[3-hydroxymyristoyl] glucosamine N-acyltransferase
LVNPNPSEAFQKTLEAFHGSTQELTGFTGIHPTAVIHESCKIGKQVTIGPYAVIDKEVHVGDGTFIGAGCYVGPYTKIGIECILHPHVIIREKCFIGNRVILQPGAIIGSCGFGYLTNKQGQHTKLNQVGTVTVEDDAEIGANTTIDRARFKTTRIGKGSKLDNLIQIAHGVNIGEHNIFAAQTGIAGSTSTGKWVMIGGQVAIAGHLKIGDRVVLAGRSGVTKSLFESGEYSGIPATPRHEHNRVSIYLRNIANYVTHIKDLQKRIEHLEDTNKNK